MAPVVRLAANSSFKDNRFDNRPDDLLDTRLDARLNRNAMARYCISKNYDYRFSGKYDPVDMFAVKLNGDRVALELMCSTYWTTQLTYPETHIHVPRHKWKMFHEQTRHISGTNINRAEKAYLVILNTACTRAAFIKFSAILNDLALFTENVKDIYNDPIIFVHIPVSYILGYINIPPEPLEIKV